MNRIIFDPVFPVPLIAAGGLLLLVLSGYYAAKLSHGLPDWQRALLAVLRITALLMLIVLLLQPSRLVPNPPQVIEDVAWIGIDTSKSMLQRDVGGRSRLDAAIDLLREESLLPSQIDPTRPTLKYFEFNESIKWTKHPEELEAEGETTRIHDVLLQAINTSKSGSRIRSVVLLTDGHDFQMVNPSRTGYMARNRHVPIYAVPFGSTGKVRDAAVRISGYPPLCYVKQKARLQAAIRLIGCKFVELECQLLRQGRVVQTKLIDTGQKQQVFVEFDVLEEETGQYEYEIRTLPITNETDTRNNSAITYLNVVDQQISVLLLEADPYWDTTMLQRSLRANEKFNIVSFVNYAPGRVHCTTSKEFEIEPSLPETTADFAKYDVIILGRKIDLLLDADRRKALEECVRKNPSTIIFSRGPALSEIEMPMSIEPVVWGDSLGVGGTVKASRLGRSTAPFAMLSGGEEVPAVVDTFSVKETKSLAVNMAGLQDANSTTPMPGFVHRRVGKGQVLAVGVTGLWRWGMNKQADGSATLFDRFWDQLLLWLLSSRDTVSNEQFAMRINSANILYGNKIYFRVLCRDQTAPKGRISISIQNEGREIENLTLNFSKAGEPLTGEWLPPKEGKYGAVASFPNGKRGKLQFIVYRENAEETEVAVDTLYLKRLCSSSGGQLLSMEDLNKQLRKDETQYTGIETRHEKQSLWDRVSVFYIIGAVFGLEWFLRRRWGLC